MCSTETSSSPRSVRLCVDFADSDAPGDEHSRGADTVVAAWCVATATGPEAVNYSMSQDFGTHFRRVVSDALMRFDIYKNYFLHSFWLDSYPSIGASDVTDRYDDLVKLFGNVVRAATDAVLWSLSLTTTPAHDDPCAVILLLQDANNDGFVDLAEFRQACADAGFPIDINRAQALLSATAGEAHATRVTVKQFLHAVYG